MILEKLNRVRVILHQHFRIPVIKRAHKTIFRGLRIACKHFRIILKHVNNFLFILLSLLLLLLLNVEVRNEGLAQQCRVSCWGECCHLLLLHILSKKSKLLLLELLLRGLPKRRRHLLLSLLIKAESGSLLL